MKLADVLRRNIVLLVCIPSLIALHYGWYKLQYNEDFVSAESRKNTKVIGLISLPDPKSKENQKD